MPVNFVISGIGIQSYADDYIRLVIMLSLIDREQDNTNNSVKAWGQIDVCLV